MSTKGDISRDNFFDQDVMKNARSGAKYWYEEIWQNVGKCVFCDLKEKYIIHEKDGIVLTTNLFPYIDGQIMIIPRRHVNSMKELSKEEWETMRMYSYLAKKIFRKVHKLKDMWYLIREGGPTAQKTVSDHLHAQLIPFDKADLAQWNYRELKYSPIENAKKYQEVSDYMDKKVENYYKNYGENKISPIIAVDAFIVNKKGQVLLGKKNSVFAKASTGTKSQPKAGPLMSENVWVLPGGRVDPNENLEEALIREAKEETGIKIKKSEIKLVSSVLTDTSFQKVNRVHKERFLVNTYVVKLNRNPKKVLPGDDLEELKWFDVKDAMKEETVFDKNLLKMV